MYFARTPNPAKSSKTTITSLEDLAAQKAIKYGVYKDGAVHEYFKNAGISPYKEMNVAMETNNAFANSTRGGVDRVLRENFAYMTDEPYLDYYNKKYPCDTTLVKHLMETKGYGIAMQRNSDMTNCVNVAILKVYIEK